MMESAAILIPAYLLAVGGFALWLEKERGHVLLLSLWALLILLAAYETIRALATLLE